MVAVAVAAVMEGEEALVVAMAAAAAAISLVGAVAGTPLWEVAVAALSDSPDVSTAVALVRDSVGRGDLLPLDFLVGEITNASVIGVSMDATTTFAIVGFAILMGPFSISVAAALDIQIIPTITHIRTTTTMGI
jgi:hypothetical protein